MNQFLKTKTINKGGKMLRNNKGFSLIEILVTVGLVAILASVAVPSYQGYKKNTVKMAMRADVSNGQKVYAAKYAMEGDYCYPFEGTAGVGLTKNKSTSPIYRNKGFYGFGANTGCSGITLTDIQFISDGDGTCSVGGHTSKHACTGASGTWTPKKDTAGENAPNCILNTNDFKIGAYSNASAINTFIQVNEQGTVRETTAVTDCQ